MIKMPRTRQPRRISRRPTRSLIDVRKQKEQEEADYQKAVAAAQSDYEQRLAAEKSRVAAETQKLQTSLIKSIQVDIQKAIEKEQEELRKANSDRARRDESYEITHAARAEREDEKADRYTDLLREAQKGIYFDWEAEKAKLSPYLLEYERAIKKEEVYNFISPSITRVTPDIVEKPISFIAPTVEQPVSIERFEFKPVRSIDTGEITGYRDIFLNQTISKEEKKRREKIYDSAQELERLKKTLPSTKQINDILKNYEEVKKITNITDKRFNVILQKKLAEARSETEAKRLLANNSILIVPKTKSIDFLRKISKKDIVNAILKNDKAKLARINNSINDIKELNEKSKKTQEQLYDDLIKSYEKELGQKISRKISDFGKTWGKRTGKKLPPIKRLILEAKLINIKNKKKKGQQLSLSEYNDYKNSITDVIGLKRVGNSIKQKQNEYNSLPKLIRDIKFAADTLGFIGKTGKNIIDVVMTDIVSLFDLGKNVLNWTGRSTRDLYTYAVISLADKITEKGDKAYTAKLKARVKKNFSKISGAIDTAKAIAKNPEIILLGAALMIDEGQKSIKNNIINNPEKAIAQLAVFLGEAALAGKTVTKLSNIDRKTLKTVEKIKKNKKLSTLKKDIYYIGKKIDEKVIFKTKPTKNFRFSIIDNNDRLIFLDKKGIKKIRKIAKQLAPIEFSDDIISNWTKGRRALLKYDKLKSRTKRILLQKERIGLRRELKLTKKGKQPKAKKAKYVFFDVQTNKERIFNNRKLFIKAIKRQDEFLKTPKGIKLLKEIEKQKKIKAKLALEKQRQLLRRELKLAKKGKQPKAIRKTKDFLFYDIVSGEYKPVKSRKTWETLIKRQEKFLRANIKEDDLIDNLKRFTKLARKGDKKIIDPAITKQLEKQRRLLRKQLKLAKKGKQPKAVKKKKFDLVATDFRNNLQRRFDNKKEYLKFIRKQEDFLKTPKGKKILKQIEKQKTRKARLELEKQRRFLRREAKLLKKGKQPKAIKPKRLALFDVNGEYQTYTSKKKWLKAIKNKEKALNARRADPVIRKLDKESKIISKKVNKFLRAKKGQVRPIVVVLEPKTKTKVKTIAKEKVLTKKKAKQATKMLQKEAVKIQDEITLVKQLEIPPRIRKLNLDALGQIAVAIAKLIKYYKTLEAVDVKKLTATKVAKKTAMKKAVKVKKAVKKKKAVAKAVKVKVATKVDVKKATAVKKAVKVKVKPAKIKTVRVKTKPKKRIKLRLPNISFDDDKLKDRVVLYEAKYRERKNQNKPFNKNTNPIVAKKILRRTTRNRMIKIVRDKVDNSLVQSMQVKAKEITDKKLKDIKKPSLSKFRQKKSANTPILILVEKKKHVFDTKGEKVESKKFRGVKRAKPKKNANDKKKVKNVKKQSKRRRKTRKSNRKKSNEVSKKVQRKKKKR